VKIHSLPHNQPTPLSTSDPEFTAMSSKPLRVGIIGPAGFGGSYLCVELLNRGHTVIGISRQPEKLGKHERYIPRSVDIDEVSVEELAKKFEGIDALVSEYGPHTAGAGALLYSPSLLSIPHEQGNRD
jgi:putative NADH-flavin reductase